MKKIKTYKSGLRLVVDTLKNFPSVVCSIRVGTGSVNDVEFKEGISHFIEHMIFKGTYTKTAQEIACYFEELGAEINAYTSQFFTNYYAKCVKLDTEKVFEQLCDIVKNSKFDNEEIEREKGVVIEEIGMEADDPFSVVSSLLGKTIYSSPNLQNDILGTIESVKSITRDDILKYVEKYYTENNIVVTFSGNISFEEAEKLTEKYFAESNEECTPVVFKESKEVLRFDSPFIVKDKQLEQAHVMIAYETENLYKGNLEKLNILSKVLGGSMSSRLFQAVREKLGLVYSIFTINNFLSSCGFIIIYFATAPKNIEKAIKAIDEVILEIKETEMEEQELKKAKKIIANELIMSKEKLLTINSKISKEMFMYGKERKDSCVLKQIEKTTTKDIKELSKKIFNNKRVVCIVGDKVSQQIKTK